MRERVGRLVGSSVRAMWVTTFHSSCARMLRADAERLGYSRSFTIYDQSDSLRMMKRCLRELGVDPKRYPPRAVHAKISGAKNQLIDADAYAETQGGVFEEVVAEAFPLYEKRMLEANAMDFDDLLVRTVNALELFEEVRERWRRASATCSSTSTRTPTTPSTGSCSCSPRARQPDGRRRRGPVDLRFRHADIRNILDFEHDFPEAAVVKLEQNYRSTQTILSAANAVVERTASGARSGSGPKSRPASRCSSRSSATSTRRRAGSRRRSSASARSTGSRAPTSRSSTGPTR